MRVYLFPALHGAGAHAWQPIGRIPFFARRIPQFRPPTAALRTVYLAKVRRLSSVYPVHIHTNISNGFCYYSSRQRRCRHVRSVRTRAPALIKPWSKFARVARKPKKPHHNGGKNIPKIQREDTTFVHVVNLLYSI